MFKTGDHPIVVGVSDLTVGYDAIEVDFTAGKVGVLILIRY